MKKQTTSKMVLKVAVSSQINQIFELYKKVIESVPRDTYSLGWNIDFYPSLKWITE